MFLVALPLHCKLTKYAAVSDHIVNGFCLLLVFQFLSQIVCECSSIHCQSSRVLVRLQPSLKASCCVQDWYGSKPA